MRAARRTQVVKGAVCKTAMQRFDSARRLQNRSSYCSIVASTPLPAIGNLPLGVAGTSAREWMAFGCG